MKMQVEIKLEIDTNDHHGVSPDCDSVLRLVESMLNREADLPFGKITIGVRGPDGVGVGTAI